MFSNKLAFTVLGAACIAAASVASAATHSTRSRGSRVGVLAIPTTSWFTESCATSGRPIEPVAPTTATRPGPAPG